MNRMENLREKARILRELIKKYATSDADVQDAYERIYPLLSDIESNSFVAPTKFPYGWIFFRGENNLLAYPDLCNAAAELADALEEDDPV